MTARSRSSPTRGGTRRARSRHCRSSGTTARRRAQSSAAIGERLKEGLDAEGNNGARQNGDARKAIAAAAKKIEAVYATPFLAHATMEPMNCTARVDRGQGRGLGADAELRRPRSPHSPRPPDFRSRNARSTGTTSAAASAGAAARRTTSSQAVAIAKQFPGTPIKMIWSREEDMTHDFFRPISQAEMAAGLDADGNLVGLHVRVSGPVDQRVLQPRGRRRRQGHAPAAGLLRGARRRAARLRACPTC